MAKAHATARSTVAAALTVVKGGREVRPPARMKLIDPVLAEKLLENNTLNRPLRDGLVEKYASDMKAGRWAGDNGETIIFSDKGNLLDGQHRLFAVIEANTPVEFMIVEGVDEAKFHTIDTGVARTFADVRSIAGKSNNAWVAGALRWFYWWRAKPRPATPSGLKPAPTHTQFRDLEERHFKDLQDRASEVGSKRRATRYLTPSILLFVYTLAYRSDPAKAGAWLAMLDSGVGFDSPDHPIKKLQDRMSDNRASSKKMKPIEMAALAVKSFNYYAQGKRKKVLVWKTVEEFPEIEV